MFNLYDQMNLETTTNRDAKEKSRKSTKLTETDGGSIFSFGSDIQKNKNQSVSIGRLTKTEKKIEPNQFENYASLIAEAQPITFSPSFKS